MSAGISIVIPSTGHLQNLERLIPSILQQQFSPADIQVVVVFNGVKEKIAETCKQINSRFPSVETLLLSGKGANLARNAGLEKANKDLVLFLDDDCELQDANTLKKYFELHSVNPAYFAIGGGYILPEKYGLYDEVYNYIQMNWFVCGQSQVRKNVVDTQYLLGGNFCLKRKLAVENGLQFEPGMIYGGTELDFFRKAVRAGLKLGAVELDVTHHTDETFLSVGKKVFKQGKGKHFIDSKFGNDDLVSQNTGGRYFFLRQLYSYWFWAGYYGEAGKPLNVFLHVLRDITGYLNALRFRILKKISR